jgi:hypothetical protein
VISDDEVPESGRESLRPIRAPRPPLRRLTSPRPESRRLGSKPSVRRDVHGPKLGGVLGRVIGLVFASGDTAARYHPWSPGFETRVPYGNARDIAERGQGVGGVRAHRGRQNSCQDKHLGQRGGDFAQPGLEAAIVGKASSLGPGRQADRLLDIDETSLLVRICDA